MPEISEVVRVSASIVPRGELRKTFGVTLFVTTDEDFLDATGAGRLKTYTDIASVGKDFATTSEPYVAAQRYFSQEPFPKALIVGRWAKGNVSSEIRTGKITASAPTTALKQSDGSFRILGTNVTGINTSSSTSWTAFATVLTTKINGTALSGFTVEWDATNTRFNFKHATYGDLSDLLTTATSSVGSDFSALLMGTEDTGATSILGSAATTLAAGLDAIEDLDSSFYFVTIEKGENDADASVDLDEWVAARSYHAMLEANSSDVLVTGETTSKAAEISANESARTNLSYSGAEEYLSLSVAARLSGVNMNGTNSLITLNLKQMPGVDPDTELSKTQIAELIRKNINYYSKFGASNAYRDGRNLKAGIWTDVRFFLDWFVNAVQVEVFNALYSSNRIPQTAAGMAVIRESIEGVCRDAIRNGGIATGTVSPATKADIIAVTGNLDFDGSLSNGYLIHSTPISEQTQIQRESRVSPQVRVFLKGSGALHEIDIDIRLEN